MKMSQKSNKKDEKAGNAGANEGQKTTGEKPADDDVIDAEVE